MAHTRLWLLTAKEGDGLWKPWYDKAFGFVVCAFIEQDARVYASGDACDEGPDAWTSAAHSDCELIGDADSALELGVVLRDFRSA